MKGALVPIAIVRSSSTSFHLLKLLTFISTQVGVAAEIPSGSARKDNLDYHSFFKFLLERGEAYEPIPPDRLNTQLWVKCSPEEIYAHNSLVHTHRSIVGNTPGKLLVDSGTFLKDIHQFDYTEFGITTKDAHLMPLSIRKLIELSFLALQDAGVDYRGKNVGCYMSGIAHDIFMISGHVSNDTFVMCWGVLTSLVVGRH